MKMGDAPFISKEVGRMWTKETEIRTPAAKLMKYTAFRFAQGSALAMR